MRFFTTIIMLFTFSLATIDATELKGKVEKWDKYNDWVANEHYVEVTVLLEDRDNYHYFRIDLPFEQINRFNPYDGDGVEIIRESPGRFVGESQFIITIGELPKRYKAIGESLSLTKEDWNIVDEEFMVTEFAPPYIIVNSEEVWMIGEASDDILGKTFRFNGEETLIPDNPGLSHFTYVSLDGSSFLKKESPSEDLRWEPSESQMAEILTVKLFGHVRTGMSHHFDAIVLWDSSGNSVYLPLANLFPFPSWTTAGNRYVKINNKLYVDIDSRFVISLDNHFASPIRSF